MIVDGKDVGRRRVTLARKLLREGEIRLVGSVKDRNPRDIDMICLIKDDLFSKYFLSIDAFIKDGHSGNWSEGRLRWSMMSIICSRILQERMKTKRMIDLKILPRTLACYGQYESTIKNSNIDGMIIEREDG